MYCTDLEGGVVATDGPVAVSANGDYATPSGASPEAGTYYWVASYSGDANNAPAASGCEDEQIGRASCRERVQISEDAASLKNNATFKDKATIAGLFGAKPGGQISWKLYDNKECKSAEGGVVATDGPVAVSANGDYATPSGASPEAGTYYWVASYSGDANNAPAASGCEDEPVTVNKKAPIPVPPRQAISGRAWRNGPQDCVAQATSAYVTGRQIKSVTVYVDGRKVKTIVRPDKNGRYGIKIKARKLRSGAHRVKLLVLYTADSQTKPSTLRLVIVRCPVPH